MDIGKSFTFMFEDPDWLRKLGIGTIVTLAGIPPFPHSRRVSRHLRADGICAGCSEKRH